MQTDIRGFHPVECSGCPEWTITIKTSCKQDLRWISEVLHQGVNAVNPCGLPDGRTTDIQRLAQDTAEVYQRPSRYD